MNSELHISQADRRPMYLQIMEQIKHRIAVGDWPPGTEIPSIRALAAATHVSVITVKRAFTDLEREGVLVTRQGKGTFVAEQVNLTHARHHEELQGHMQAAVSAALQMGLSEAELEARWRATVEKSRRKEP
ncbi:MAG TPA: GntR family transcriptional regulator [Candidatus Acidoferrum sp.]|nr:GntR family transcriptional regulator [Candidatus Acidoferrum sp.]